MCQTQVCTTNYISNFQHSTQRYVFVRPFLIIHNPDFKFECSNLCTPLQLHCNSHMKSKCVTICTCNLLSDLDKVWFVGLIYQVMTYCIKFTILFKDCLVMKKISNRPITEADTNFSKMSTKS